MYDLTGLLISSCFRPSNSWI